MPHDIKFYSTHDKAQATLATARDQIGRILAEHGLAYYGALAAMVRHTDKSGYEGDLLTLAACTPDQLKVLVEHLNQEAKTIDQAPEEDPPPPEPEAKAEPPAEPATIHDPLTDTDIKIVP